VAERNLEGITTLENSTKHPPNHTREKIEGGREKPKERIRARAASSGPSGQEGLSHINGR